MKDWQPWIKFVSYPDSDGKLRTLYDRIKGPNDNVDNIMMVHSLRPHTLEGQMAIYKNVLHHTSLPKWLLEIDRRVCEWNIISMALNGCCVTMPERRAHKNTQSLSFKKRIVCLS